MRPSVGQQVIAGGAILLGIAVTLAIGFVLAQTDNVARLGDITPGSAITSAPGGFASPIGTGTFTPTSATRSVQPTDLPSATNTPPACTYPANWQPAVAGQSDSLSSLAALYATTPETLMQGNCLTEPAVRPGQVIYLPPVPTATEERCGPPSGWTTYVVQSGENLFRIGLRYGQTVAQMLRANCLTSDRVKTGQTLYVPPVTPRPGSPTPGPIATAGAQVVTTPGPAPGCNSPGAQITSPAAGSTLNGDILFYGTATAGNFSFYKLEIRPAGGSTYTTFFGEEAPVANNLLGRVGAYAFPPGKYVIRLAVVDITGTVVGQCSINLTLEGGATATSSATS